MNLNHYENQISKLQKKIVKNTNDNHENISINNHLELMIQVNDAMKSWNKEKIYKLIIEEVKLKSEMINEDVLITIKYEYIHFLVGLTEKIIEDRLLEVEKAFLILNGSIQLIEEAQNETDAVQVVLACAFEYMRYIHDRIKKSRHYLIILVKENIHKNLNTKINIAKIAEEIGTNSSYLSRLFHQKEGITIKQYIANERMKQAQRLLCSTEYTNDEICQCLGFSSKSYFGKMLKESTGMTPNQYRLQFKLQNKSIS